MEVTTVIQDKKLHAAAVDLLLQYTQTCKNTLHKHLIPN
jgi:hypothetical protein